MEKYYFRGVFRKFILFLSVWRISVLGTSAQHYYLPLSNELNSRYDSSLYKLGSGFHTSIKPYMSNEVNEVTSVDSGMPFERRSSSFGKTLAGRKIFSEHLFQIRKDDYSVYLDPLFEFSAGKSMEGDSSRNTYVNARGYNIGGTFGEHFSFATTFLETQASFSSYIDSAIRATSVVPGSGRTKKLYGDFDFGASSGSIAFSLKKHFSFQLGYDRNFIGDGYRSLLLSDNAYSQPFMKVNTTFGKIKYMVLYNMFLDGPDGKGEDRSYRRKYGTFHYLDINLGKRFTLGVLDCIIWKYDSTRAFDITYMNPVIFLRPVEFSIGSPDNAMMGLNFKYKLNSSNSLYGQVILDEFKIDEVKAGNGWWADKHGFQLGLHSFSIFRIKRLDFSSEFNYVRPYTYQHRSTGTAYAHFNQPLAHPLGANFWESSSSLNYSYKRWHVFSRLTLARIGYDRDSSGNLVNYGNNVLLSYETHPNEYGNETGQGLTTSLLNAELRMAYLLNPASNILIEAGTRMRVADNYNGKSETLYVFFGIRTMLGNRYFDF